MALTILGFFSATGQLANAKGTLYTVPANKVAVITEWLYINTDNAAAHTVNAYINDSGTSHRECPVNKVLAIANNDGDFDVLGIPRRRPTLAAGALIEGDADTGAKVDYRVSGLLISV